MNQFAAWMDSKTRRDSNARVLRSGKFAAFVVAISISNLLLAETKLDDLSPRALNPIRPTTIALLGKDLVVDNNPQATRILCSEPAFLHVLPESKPDRLMVQVSFRDLPQLQIVSFQVLTAKGISEPILACVDSFAPTLNGPTLTSDQRSLPFAIDAKSENLKETSYTVYLEKNTFVHADIMAARLGSQLDGMLTVRDKKGKEIAYSDDRWGADPQVSFQVEEDGEHEFLVRDVQYRGNLPYRLRIGHRSSPKIYYPLAFQHQVEPVFAEQQPNHGTKLLPFVKRRSQQIRALFERDPFDSIHFAGFVLSSPYVQVPFQTSPTNVQLPCKVHGRFDSKPFEHVYQFDARKDEPIELRVFSHRLGSPAVVKVVVQRSNEKVVAKTSPSRIDDQSLRFTPEESEKLTVRISELHRNHGPAYRYLVAIDNAPSKFELRLHGDKNSKNYRHLTFPGGIIRFPIQCLRHGYNGPIQIEQATASGLQLLPTQIAAGKNDVQVTLVAGNGATRNSITRVALEGFATDFKSMPQASSVLLNVKQRLPNDLKRQTVLPNSLSETISVGIVPSFFKLFPTDPTIQITAGDKGAIPIEVHFSEKQEVEFSVSGLPAGCKVEKNLKMNSSGTQQFSVAVDANAKPGKSSIRVDCSTNYHGHRIMTRSLPFEFEIVAAPEPAKKSPDQQDKSE